MEITIFADGDCALNFETFGHSFMALVLLGRAHVGSFNVQSVQENLLIIPLRNCRDPAGAPISTARCSPHIASKHIALPTSFLMVLWMLGCWVAAEIVRAGPTKRRRSRTGACI